MIQTASAPKAVHSSWFSRSLRRVLALLRSLALALVVIWIGLAVYFSNLPWSLLRLALAAAAVAFSVWALWLTRRPRMGWAFAGLFLVVLAWFSSIPPSHDRLWRREVAVMPRADIDGDRVRITGFRNFDYRTSDDFTERWEEREVSLSHLTSVDFFIAFWSPGPYGHTFVSFNFDNAPPVCISIETRREADEGWGTLPALFKQFELIYVVGAERDIVGVRINHYDQEVFLYRIQTAPENARRLFLVYLDRINELADRPEWYHLLTNQCTINIVRHANAAGRVGWWDIRHLINGWADRYLYDAGLLDTSLPFDELRRRSRIDSDAASAVDDPDFSRRIRESLPTIEESPDQARSPGFQAPASTFAPV